MYVYIYCTCISKVQHIVHPKMTKLAQSIVQHLQFTLLWGDVKYRYDFI